MAQWLDRLEGAVPVAPVNDLPTALRERQVVETSMLVSFQHPVFGEVRQVAGPVQVSSPPPPPTPAPALGADTWSVLHALAGLDAATFQELLADRVVAQAPPDSAGAGGSDGPALDSDEQPAIAGARTDRK